MKQIFYFLAVSFTIAGIGSCSKSDPNSPAGTNDPCAGKTITISAATSASTGCSNDGNIVASATGSTGFTYKLNASGSFQASGMFSNLSPGNYTVIARDTDGCEKSAIATIATGTRGVLFTQVRNLVTAKCQSCHNNALQNGGQNWEPDCNIVNNQVRIKVRAVDEGTMPAGGPPLTVGEKAVITNWINAGGRLTD